MNSNISRRKIRKLLRENSSESSLSKSISNAPELNELSIERIRGAIGKNSKRNDLSMKNLQALFKIYQMESNKLIDFAGIFSLNEQQIPTYLNTLASYIPNQPDMLRKNWYHLLSLKFPTNLDNDCISLITMVHSILHYRILDPVPSLLLLNYLIILTFWQDFGSLSMDKSNLLMDHIKGITKAFIKIVKQNKQDLYNSNYLQLVENVGSELYPFLLTLFQIIKKKSNYYYCFICLSEIIDKLAKKNLLRSLGLNTLNQLEISLNKKQKLIFEEIFLRQADPVFDRNLLFKSTILKPYKEDLFNAFLAFEYRNNISFTKLLYFFDSICEICKKIEVENPKTYEKTLEFKMLIKTLTEMFEYFCSKLSNLNTESLLMLDEETEQIAYLARFLSRKKRQELSNAYVKVNEYFDKTPSSEVIETLDLIETHVIKTKQDSKKKKKGNNDFSNKVLASLKIIKKIDNLQKRVQEMMELFDKIIRSQDYVLSTKAKLKIGKTVLKVLDMVTKLSEIDNSFRKEIEEFIIMFLQVPSLIHKAFLKKLKQRYELFIQEHKVQGRPEIFKLITQNLQAIFMSDDEATKQLQGLSLNRNSKGSNKTMDLRVKYEEDEDEEDYADEEDEEEEDDDEDEEDADEEDGNEEKETSFQKAKGKKVGMSETPIKMAESMGKKTKSDKNLQDIKSMLEEHFKDIIHDSTAVINPTQINTYLVNIDSLFHETSNHIMSSLVNMSNEEVNELIDMLNNIVHNLALNWLVHLSDTNKAIHELKGLFQNYRKFLKFAEIFTRFSYQILLDESNIILGSSFLPISVDSKSEIIEYDAKIVENHTTHEKFYDIEYFFKLEQFDVQDPVGYLGEFVDSVCANKARVPVFNKLVEEAKTNPSFKVYGYHSELARGTALRNLVVSYEVENRSPRFVILPVTLNVVML